MAALYDNGVHGPLAREHAAGCPESCAGRHGIGDALRGEGAEHGNPSPIWSCWHFNHNRESQSYRLTIVRPASIKLRSLNSAPPIASDNKSEFSTKKTLIIMHPSAGGAALAGSPFNSIPARMVGSGVCSRGGGLFGCVCEDHVPVLRLRGHFRPVRSLRGDPNYGTQQME